LVNEILNDTKAAGNHEIILGDEDLSSGNYILHLKGRGYGNLFFSKENDFLQ